MNLATLIHDNLQSIGMIFAFVRITIVSFLSQFAVLHKYEVGTKIPYSVPPG